LGSLAEFITKYDGKTISGYTDSGGQCIDEVRRWIQWMIGNAYHGIPNVSDAEDMWKLADTRYWEKHSARSLYVPKRNGILVMKGRVGQPHGHVAVIRDGSTLHDTYTFDQNWSLTRRCARERHGRDPVRSDRNIGFLVLKK
jgi:hypothetical protein